MTYPQPDQPPYDPQSQQPQYPAQYPPQYPPQYPQVQQPWGPPSPPATPAKRKVWPWVVGGILLLIVLGSIGNASKSTSSTISSSPSLATSPASSSLPSSVQAAPAPAPAPAGPLTTFGNGTYLVGEDVAPGTYRSPSPQEKVFKICYWDAKNSKGDFIDQGVANEGPSRATLKAGQTFTSSGCEDWVKVG